MARAPFQVLVIPFFMNDLHEAEFAIFQRQPKSGGFWQWISGGGEGGESTVGAARREVLEEAGIESGSLYKLDSLCMIQRDLFKGHEKWIQSPYVIPEYSFAFQVEAKTVKISAEHQAYNWTQYTEATKLLKWDSNRTALWELNLRILKKDLKSL